MTLINYLCLIFLSCTEPDAALNANIFPICLKGEMHLMSVFYCEKTVLEKKFQSYAKIH